MVVPDRRVVVIAGCSQSVYRMIRHGQDDELSPGVAQRLSSSFVGSTSASLLVFQTVNRRNGFSCYTRNFL